MAALLMLIAALITPAAGARESDRSQPVSIDADHAEINRAIGQSRYFGDVVFEQGSLRITGNRLVIDSANGSIQRARVWGHAAHVRQRTNAGNKLRAHANAIDYNLDAGKVLLTGDAEVRRDGDHFAAERIRYWPSSGRVKGFGGDDDGRVHIRLEPDNDKSDGDATNSNDKQAP